MNAENGATRGERDRLLVSHRRRLARPSVRTSAANVFALTFLVASACCALGCRNKTHNTSATTAATATDPAHPPPAQSTDDAATRAHTGAEAAAECGPLRCELFDTASDALSVALATDPVIVAIGEAHAQKGDTGVPSAAKRFTGELLPLFQGRASDLIVELMLPPNGCHEKVDQVRAAHKPVTDKQAIGDQGEYIALGEAAKRLGIVPDLLRPSCDDMEAISRAGDDAIAKTLETIARLTARQVKAILARPGRGTKAIVVYGGAIHGDLGPPPERAAWSYGPELSALVNDRYVAVNLFVPEYIDGGSNWQKFAWFPFYGDARRAGKTILFNPSERSFVLIFEPARGEGGAPPL